MFSLFCQLLFVVNKIASQVFLCHKDNDYVNIFNDFFIANFYKLPLQLFTRNLEIICRVLWPVLIQLLSRVVLHGQELHYKHFGYLNNLRHSRAEHVIQRGSRLSSQPKRRDLFQWLSSLCWRAAEDLSIFTWISFAQCLLAYLLRVAVLATWVLALVLAII